MCEHISLKATTHLGLVNTYGKPRVEDFTCGQIYQKLETKSGFIDTLNNWVNGD